MRAIHVERPGGPEALQPIELPIPVPADGEVRVRVASIGVNFADVLCRRATHRSMRPPPIVPGCEAAGVIDACGPGVDPGRVGERVGVYSPFGGAYAEWLVVPSAYALPLPDTMGFEDAAAFTHLALTADAALHRVGDARPGMTLLVTAAAGGLGSMLTQYALSVGLRVFAAAGSADKCATLEGRGFEGVFDYGHADFDSQVLEATGGRGVDRVVETVGGDLYARCEALLAPLGRIVIAGAASGALAQPQAATLLDRSASVATLNLSVIYATAPDAMRGTWNALVTRYLDGHLVPRIGHRFVLADAIDAHRLIESRRSRDKIVLAPGR